jgi:DNA mismatch repair protein MutS
MTFSEKSGSDRRPSADGGPADRARRMPEERTAFRSVLFDRAGSPPDLTREQPDFFEDLNLDQVLRSLVSRREQHELEPFFYSPLRDPSEVRYRHEVFRDLEQPEVLESVTSFAAAMQRMRDHLRAAENLRYELQQQAWFVDAADVYCGAVQSLSAELAAHDITSRALQRFREYLARYVSSAAFTSLVTDTEAVKDAFAGLRYSLRIDGARVTVTRYDGAQDYSAQVLETFARFRQGAVKSYLVDLPEDIGMDHIEAQILEGVSKLHPQPFRTRAEYCARHADFLEATVAGFDREVQFYVGYLELVQRLRKGGLSFCYPRVSSSSKEIGAADAFDIALALKLASGGPTVVTNEFQLNEPERMLILSGPNNGGKTTFARMFGQLHHLASLGLLVPGSEARLFLPDRIYTHFEREEEVETLRGKFDDELVRVHGILEEATSKSVIVMNESFSSTTLNDALFVGTEVMKRILALGAIGVYVTFVDEIASISDATVSMVAQIVPENPAERTFKILRQPADGLAYAWAIAEKYGLTYERLMERIGA